MAAENSGEMLVCVESAACNIYIQFNALPRALMLLVNYNYVETPPGQSHKLCWHQI